MKNHLFDNLLTRLDTRFADDSDRMSMSTYIETNTRLRGKPFSFKGYEFQRAIVDDMHPNLSVVKISQCGLTEVQIRKFLCFLKRTSSINGIFSLPDDNMLRRVSQTRIKPIIDAEPVFNQHNPADKPIRSIGTYQIDGSFGFITGGKEGDATSINCDVMFNDEIDLTSAEMLALYSSRLQGSQLRIRQGFSTPTFEGYGVDSQFRASDQHEYLCRCTRCNHHNIPDFTPSFLHIPNLPADLNDLSEIDPDIAARLGLDDAYVRCEHCSAPLDLANPDLREWVPRHPGRIGRGYRVRPFSSDRLSIKYIIEQLLQYKQKNALRRWHNTVLGNAYNDSNTRLSLLEIEAVMHGEGEPSVSSDIPVAIGIDVGNTCHVVLAHLGSAVPTVFSWRQIASENLVDEVTTILATYNVVAGGMDLNPYAPLAREIRDLSKSVISPIEYAAPTAPAITEVTDEFDVFSHVRSNRTMVIDELVRDVRKRQIAFVGYGPKKHIIQTHLMDMVRVEVPEKAAVWNKLTGDDHFLHATSYMRHSLKIKAVRDFSPNEDQEDRIMALIFGSSTVQQTAEVLGVKGLKKNPSVLGLA